MSSLNSKERIVSGQEVQSLIPIMFDFWNLFVKCLHQSRRKTVLVTNYFIFLVIGYDANL